MHPAIGAGVLEHSDFFGDPYGRVFRSLPRILGAVYDGPEADATGREVRDFHRPIKGVDDHGRRYHALDPETFWWAHATFQYMAEQVADRFDRHRVTPDEREQLYQEGIEWYRRYGVSDRSVPPDRAAFQEKWDYYCAEVLELNAASAWVLNSLRSSALSSRASRAAAAGTAAAVGQDDAGPALGLPGGADVRLRWTAPGGAGALRHRVVERGRRGARRPRAGRGNAWPIVPATMRWQPRALEGWQRVRAEQRMQAA